MKNLIFLAGLFWGSFSTALALPSLDSQVIESLTGGKGEGAENSNGYTVSFPLSNLKVRSVGVQLTPALGLSCSASFIPSGEEVKVIGKFVLLEDQVNIVLKEALENGFNVTSLYNHSLWELPRLMTLTIEGSGKLADLATRIGTLFQIVKKSSSVAVWKAPLFLNAEKSTLSKQNLEETLKSKATLKNGVYEFVWAFSEAQAPSRLVFAGTDAMAVMFGEVSTPTQSIQNILKTFMKHNIYVTSIQNMGEMSVIHFMNRGPALELAQGIKDVLGTDATLSPQEQR